MFQILGLTGHLQEHLSTRCQHDPMERPLRSHPEQGLQGHGSRQLERGLDVVDFLLYLGGVRVGGVEQTKDLAGLLDPVHLHQPTGGFGQGEDEGQDDEGQDDLKREGKPPGHRAGIVGHAEVDPEGQRQAETAEDAKGRHVGPSTVGLGQFGLPDRHGRDDAAGAQADHDARHDELAEREGRGHEHRPDHLYHRGQEDGTPTAEHIA